MAFLFGIRRKIFVKAPEACRDATCGFCLGIFKGVCNISLYTTKEVEEIESSKKLGESLLKKSPEFITEESVCDGIKAGTLKSLAKFKNNLSDEAVDAIIDAAAAFICKKSFYHS